jgi:DNA-binding transcriptional LysR family regulator
VISALPRFIFRAMNLHQLELFYHVARSGGISRALRHIPYGIQQPAVSIQILALEEHLGAKLFDRQPFRLTAEGRELFEFARPFFDRLGAVEERLQRKRSPLFRLAASELVLRDYLPAVLRQIKQQHPELRFRLRSGLQAEVERWLLDGEVDLAIMPLESRPKAGLHAEPLVRLPLVLLVPARAKIKSAAQLWEQNPINEPLICLPAEECIAKLFYQGLRQLKVDWPTAIEASSTDLVTQYVANGYGLGVSVDVPAVRSARGVRVIPLPGFTAVEVVALWCRTSTALHREVRAAITQRARELFPQAAGRVR